MSRVRCEGVADEKCVDRFRAKVADPNENGCLNWTGSGKRYGKFRGGPKGKGGRASVPAHAFAWTIENGDVSDELVLRHRCDNGMCVNVEHLELGTQLDNMRDKLARYVNPDGGEGTNTAKLTHEQAAEVYRLAHEGRLKQKDIAEIYGIDRTTVSHIKAGRHRAYSVNEHAA
ncbi:hypothetical protein ZEMLYA_56 [Streptomyces phage Zemlya]|uniref:HNH nuclease domain-containing protein n=1 Tax=Streptomyces phage Zemlya TaxID=1327760 RepID=R4TIL4_9CAUD|nr:endonuclease [Streptomyces phage Zemlya]AGM12231.1 hypothetical protein ZEMLYA_56 [Streptomyces phage Zemlya]